MADTNLEFEALRAQRSNGQPDQSEATRLASLRTLAQQHLEEISQMTRDERLQEEKRMEELEAEMRRRKHQKPSKPSDNQDGGDAKESRMRSAQEVLDRLRGDPSLKIDEHRVGYIDRFGGIQELPASQWIRESTDEEWIPQHRIRYFKRIGVDHARAGSEPINEIVWHRDQRVDKIFGSM